jgi:hypothetical protein
MSVQWGVQDNPLLQIPLDFIEGAGGKVLSTVRGASQLAHKVIPQIPVLPEEYTSTPPTWSSKIGGFTEQAGEFMVPAGWAGKAEKAATASTWIPGLLKPVVRAGVQAVPAATVTALQTGGDARAMEIAAAIAAGTTVPIPVAKWALNKLVAKADQLTPAQRAAVQYLQQKLGIYRAGMATGNKYVQGLHEAAESTPGGALATAGMDKAETEALAQGAEDLTQRAHPASTEIPESAGRGARGSLAASSQQFADEADVAYGEVRRIAKNPVNTQTVVQGTKEVPALDVDGNPVYLGGKLQTKKVDITEDIALPVDLSDAQRQLKPIYDRIVTNLGLVKAQMMPGFQALENIVNSKPFQPAMDVEEWLGAVKKLAREGSGRSAGAAKKAISEVQGAVDDAVSAADDPNALQYLQYGRFSRHAQAGADAVLDELRAEPVNAFEQLTTRRDKGIDLLRTVASTTKPETMRALGRAWLEDAFRKATSQGGFGGAKELWSRWVELGDSTKGIIFEPGLKDELDKFFLGARMMADNTFNPSKSTVLGHIIGSTVAMVASPHYGVPYNVGWGAVAKLLRSRAGVELLTKGIQTPTNSAAAPGLAVAIARAAGWAPSKEEIEKKRISMTPPGFARGGTVLDRAPDRAAVLRSLYQTGGAVGPVNPKYQTALTPQQEAQFQNWVKQNNVPFDPGPYADYDMRGFWKGMTTGDPRARTGISPYDKQLHFTDTWKTPYHRTFSNESIYAPKDAPHWEGDRLIDKDGKVVADETPKRMQTGGDVGYSAGEAIPFEPSQLQYTTPEGTEVYTPPPKRYTPPAAMEEPEGGLGRFMEEALINPAAQLGAGTHAVTGWNLHLGANILDLLDKGASGIANLTGTTKGGAFKQLADMARQQQHDEEQKAAELSQNRQDIGSLLWRAVPQALGQLPAYMAGTAAFGPILGMGGIGALEASDQGPLAALRAGAEGALTGGMMHVMAPASRAVRALIGGGAAGLQGYLSGQTPEQALASGITTGTLSAQHPGGVTASEILARIPTGSERGSITLMPRAPGAPQAEPAEPGRGMITLPGGAPPTAVQRDEPSFLTPQGAVPPRGDIPGVLGAEQRRVLTPQEWDLVDKYSQMYPGFSEMVPYMSALELQKTVALPGNVEALNQLMTQIPNEANVAAVAKFGAPKRGWYRGSAHAIMDVFGNDAPRFTALLAAMSPRTSVEANLFNTLMTWKNWNAAGRPTDPKAIMDIMARSVQGQKGMESVLGAWRDNAIGALSTEDPVKFVLSGPKVDSFYHNLGMDVMRLTNDAWVAGAMGLHPDLFSGSGRGARPGDPGLTPGYIGTSIAQRRAAQMLGWHPSEVQETMWSVAKPAYEMQRSTGMGARDLLQRGLITPQVIRDVPDFSNLMKDDPRVREMLEQMGYGPQVQAARRFQWPQSFPSLSTAEQNRALEMMRTLEQLKAGRALESGSERMPAARQITTDPRSIYGARGKPETPQYVPPASAYVYAPREFTPGAGIGHGAGYISQPYSKRAALTGSQAAALQDIQGRDILYPQAGIESIPARPATGLWYSNRGREINPMTAFGLHTPTAGWDLPQETVNKMQAIEATLGMFYGQRGMSTVGFLAKPGGMNYHFESEGKVPPQTMEAVSRILRGPLQNGQVALADTARGTTLMNFTGQPLDPKLLKRLEPLLSPQGQQYKEGNTIGTYVDLANNWLQKPGSQMVSRQVLGLWQQVDPHIWAAVDNNLKSVAEAALKEYQTWPGKKMKVRSDLMRALDLSARHGTMGLVGEVAKGTLLPAVAAAVLLPSVKSVLQDQQEEQPIASGQ